MHSLFILGSLIHITTVVKAQSWAYGGPGRFPCSSTVNGVTTVNPAACNNNNIATTQSPACVGSWSPFYGNVNGGGFKNYGYIPQNSQCIQDPQLLANWYCGFVGAACDPNASGSATNCDNGVCSSAGICVGGLGSPCIVDSDCLGNIYCLNPEGESTGSGVCGFTTDNFGGLGALCADGCAGGNFLCMSNACNGYTGACSLVDVPYCPNAYTNFNYNTQECECSVPNAILVEGSCQCSDGTSGDPNEGSCSPCASGTYGTGGSCTPCGGGLSSPSGSTSVAECTTCAVSNAIMSGGICQCPDGTSSDANNDPCSPCASGTYGTGGSCNACGPDLTSPSGSTSADQCACPLGSSPYTLDLGGGDVLTGCTCDGADYYTNGLTSECTACPANITQLTGTNTGTCQCPGVETFNTNDGTCSCNYPDNCECRAGSTLTHPMIYNPNYGGYQYLDPTCVCDDTSEIYIYGSGCITCPLGSWPSSQDPNNEALGSDGIQTCDCYDPAAQFRFPPNECQCTNGFVLDSNGFCNNCPANTYSVDDGYGDISCTACGPNMISPAGSTDISQCTIPIAITTTTTTTTQTTTQPKTSTKSTTTSPAKVTSSSTKSSFQAITTTKSTTNAQVTSSSSAFSSTVKLPTTGVTTSGSSSSSWASTATSTSQLSTASVVGVPSSTLISSSSSSASSLRSTNSVATSTKSITTSDQITTSSAKSSTTVKASGSASASASAGLSTCIAGFGIKIGAAVCSACTAGTYSVSGNSAPCQVPAAGYYALSGLLRTCPSPSSVATCSPTTGVAVTCRATYALSLAGTCTLCPAGQYANNGTCAACLAPQSLTCDAATGLLALTCLPGLIHKAGVCTSCSGATYPKTTVFCAACPDIRATTCDADGTTITCKPGYANIAGTCSRCSAGTYALNSTCIACVSSTIATCDPVTGAINTCVTGLIRKSGACIPCTGATYAATPLSCHACLDVRATSCDANGASLTCKTGWANMNGTCAQCTVGYASNSTCIPCISATTASCDPVSGVTLTCQPGLLRQSGACIPCAAGTYLKEPLFCAACLDAHASTCDSTTGLAITCKNGWAVSGTVCVRGTSSSQSIFNGASTSGSSTTTKSQTQTLSPSPVGTTSPSTSTSSTRTSVPLTTTTQKV